MGKIDIVFRSSKTQPWKGLLRNAADRDVPVVAVGSAPTGEDLIGAIKAGALDYLCAGLELAELRWIPEISAAWLPWREAISVRFAAAPESHQTGCTGRH